MSLGSQSDVVNGQRFVIPTWDQWSPTQYGPQSTGVPNVSPTIPPYVNGGSVGLGGSAGGAGMVGVGGYGTADNNSTVTAIANANPHSLKVSPVWWTVGLLLIGLFLLKAVNWRDTVLESGKASLKAGPAKAEGSEEA